MKKIMIAVLLTTVALVGCSNASKQSKIEENQIIYGVNFTASKYKSYFDASPSEIIQSINEQADDNFSIFYQLNDDNDRLWTQNGEYWSISITSDTFTGADGKEYTRPYKAEIDFSALGSPEEAGYAIEAFIATFLPNNVDDVTYDYDIYGENTSYDSTTHVIVGNIGYLNITSERHESLTIQANGPLLKEESNLPVKPQ